MSDVLFIYGLVDDCSGSVFYVGNTAVPASRLLRHRDLRRRADFEMHLFEACFDELDAAQAEQRWIDYGRAEGWPLENVKPAPRNGISRRRIAQIEAYPIWRARPPLKLDRKWVRMMDAAYRRFVRTGKL